MEKRELLNETFKWVFFGLLVCGIVAYVASLNVNAVYNSLDGLSWVIFLLVELGVCIALTAFIRKLQPVTAKILYLVYAGLTGLSLNGIFLLYTESSIAFVFLITALIFGAFALIGKNTNADLSKLGIYLFVALIAVIVLEIVNIFILSRTLNMALCIATIVIFCGYTAFDVNRLLKSTFLDDSENKGIYFAFQLFLDFINLFIELLKIFGKRKD